MHLSICCVKISSSHLKRLCFFTTTWSSFFKWVFVTFHNWPCFSSMSYVFGSLHINVIFQLLFCLVLNVNSNFYQFYHTSGKSMRRFFFFTGKKFDLLVSSFMRNPIPFYSILCLYLISHWYYHTGNWSRKGCWSKCNKILCQSFTCKYMDLIHVCMSTCRTYIRVLFIASLYMFQIIRKYCLLLVLGL